MGQCTAKSTRQSKQTLPWIDRLEWKHNALWYLWYSLVSLVWFPVCEYIYIYIRHVMWCHVIPRHIHPSKCIRDVIHACTRKKENLLEQNPKNHSPGDSVFAPSQRNLCRAPQRHWVALHYPFHRRHSCMAVQSENLRHILTAARSTTTIPYHPVRITYIYIIVCKQFTNWNPKIKI